MSTERGGGTEQSRSFQKKGAAESSVAPSPDRRIGEPAQSESLSGVGLLTGREEVVTGETGRGLYQVQTAVVSESEQSPLASKPEPPQAEGATASTEGLSPQSEGSQGFPSRQVIAVSASKGPAAFFNLARKFLVTDEMCDLSALEGAIVSAVDAAHLLERSKLATIVRVQTSYVAVEPKRKKHQDVDEIVSGTDHQQGEPTRGTPEARPAHELLMTGTDEDDVSKPLHVSTTTRGQATTSSIPAEMQSEFPRSRKPQGRAKGSPLRRARIIITVKRTPEYKQWLEENPLQAAITGDSELLEGVPSAHAALARDPPRRKL